MQNGLTLLVVGMGTVFGFLVLLVATMRTATSLILRCWPEQPVSTPQRGPVATPKPVSPPRPESPPRPVPQPSPGDAIVHLPEIAAAVAVAHARARRPT